MGKTNEEGERDITIRDCCDALIKTAIIVMGFIGICFGTGFAMRFIFSLF